MGQGTSNLARHSMRNFFIIWFGQLVSLTGTGMTRFALFIWAFEQTGQATSIALLGFFSYLFFALTSPYAGVIVDWLDRRAVMLAADLAAGCMTLILLALFADGRLALWHAYALMALTGVFEAFQLPAYLASVSVLVPKRHYARAAGLRSVATSAAMVLSPLFATLALEGVSMEAVFIADLATFVVAMVTLTIVRIPRPDVSEKSDADADGGALAQIRFGFRYIRQRPGLLFLLGMFMGMNIIATLTYFSILPAMVLARSGNETVALTGVEVAIGAGSIVGGVLMSVWGGPKKRIHGVLLFAALSFIFGDFVLGTGRSALQWMLGGFIASFFIPFIVGADRAIWQSKIAPDIQGRVFGVQALFRQGVQPIGFLVAGPLADKVFEPALSAGGALSDSLGWLVGVGPGAGMGLMFVFTSVMGLTVALSGYLIPAVRNVDEDLPDYDAVLVAAD